MKRLLAKEAADLTRNAKPTLINEYRNKIVDPLIRAAAKAGWNRVILDKSFPTGICFNDIRSSLEDDGFSLSHTDQQEEFLIHW